MYRTIITVALLAAGCQFDGSAGDLGVEPDAPDPAQDPDDTVDDRPRTVFVHLFEWPWPDVARECEAVLGPGGFAAVQVSPPQEHAVFPTAPWWQRYQPVSYAIDSRSGDRAAFADMVERCAAVGVDIYVDAVINHMSFLDSGVGSAGTPHTRYSYPGLYGDADFHDCRRGIDNYNSREEVQTCDLATAPDLDTSSAYVRGRLADYLDDLMSLGVAGFRIDGAKHIAVDDLVAILDAAGGDPYVFAEVIDFGGEAVSGAEYTGLADVTEFRYSAEIARVFRSGQLAWLDEFGEAWGMLPDEDAVVFVDNHDNQRGHGAPADAIHFRDGRLHEIANIFVLAWPYGRPKLMSSYEFVSGDDGPPAVPVLTTAGACASGWACEHRRPTALAMVKFRNLIADAPVSRWWSNGNDQIAFAREGLGFVAINREEASQLTQELETGLAPGRYCDVLTGGVGSSGCVGREVEVGTGGVATIQIGSLDALAIHVESRL